LIDRLTIASIASMFFLSMIDTTIAATSLVAITNDLSEFELASWILTSYLLGYVGKLPFSRDERDSAEM
jgi:MFS family permease